MKKEWVVKNKPTQKEVLHVVDSIKLTEQVQEGILFVDRVDVSDLHPLVVETISENQKGQDHETVPESSKKEQEWQTVMTRRRAKQNVVDKKGNEGFDPGPANG
ncbi:hypothetical protein RIF29_33767 [Crotalaria pallida]|uniref:Uncharacterized protein n=1 Tax=Crotalaria pallida TaxID=3830 RepID=A0AAN9E863_CROPI